MGCCWFSSRLGSYCGFATIADDRDHGANVDGLTLFDANFDERAGDRRRHLGVDLIRRHFEQRLVFSDRVADLLEPLSNGALGDRFAELRKNDV